MVEHTSDIRVLTSELVKRLNDDSRRIRSLEMNMERLEASVSNLEQTLSENLEDVRGSFQKLDENIKSLANRLSNLESTIQKLQKDLENKSTKVELKELENYVSLMNPMNVNFVTKDELEKILEEKLGKKV